MCPVCLTTVVLIAGSATSTGGLAAVAMKKFGVKNAASTTSRLFRRENGAGENIPNLNQRRDQDVNEHD
jgi:hypothetical protein